MATSLLSNICWLLINENDNVWDVSWKRHCMRSIVEEKTSELEDTGWETNQGEKWNNEKRKTRK